MTQVISLIPTKNEEKGIKETIVKVNSCLNPDFITVVDAHSTDKTVEIAKSLGVDVILQTGVGKGAGIITFIEETKYYPEDTVVVMTDADSTYGLETIRAHIEKMENKGMLVGSRFLGKIEPGALTLLNRVGNKIFSFIATLLLKKKVTDLLSGLRIFRISALRDMGLTAHGFDTETEMTVKCIKKGLGYSEFPCNYYKRLGKSNLHPVKDGIVILKRLFNSAFFKEKS